MPIYEYKCPSCRKVFEEWVKTHDTAPQPCPDCGALSPHIVSNTTFVLKGGGWYVTEYGNRKGESASESSTPTPAASSDAPAAAAADAPVPAASSSDTAAPSTPSVPPPAPVAKSATAKAV